jgi:hypothetical protein
MSHRWADPAGIAILAPVSDVAQAVACAAAGARLADVGLADELIPAIRMAAGSLLVCGRGEAADVVRDAGLAASTGAALICPDLGMAASAARRGIPPERILVQCTPAGIERAAAAGWAALVDADAAADPLAGVQAVAAVCAWRGASVISTRHVGQVRRAVDMAESIRGTRPPARAIRGLA